MAAFAPDLKSGFRILTKSPGPAAAAVLVLALGIGLSTSMFSIVDGILFRDLPFEDGHRLFHVGKSRWVSQRNARPLDFFEWRAQQSSFEDLAAFAMTNVFVSDGHTAERYQGAAISAEAFAQLRVRAALGGVFTEAHDRPGAEPVVLLGDRVWRQAYGADPEIVGTTLLVDGRPATVLGVMPEGFRFPLFQDVWYPLKADASDPEWGRELYLEVFGRLRDGVTLDAARLEMSLIARRLAEAHPDTHGETGAVVKPYTAVFHEGPEGYAGLVGLGAVAFVLLIACANVANLLLARTAARSKEIAVRTALGASRGRVIAQVLAESFCLSVPAAVVGLGLAFSAVEYFNAAVAGRRWPYWFDVGIGATALAVVVVLALAATLLSGLVPAVRASRIDAHAVLKAESRGAGLRIGRLSKGLVIAEVALSFVLLIGAGLMVRSVVNLARIDFAFETASVFTARMGLLEQTYGDDASRVRFWRRLQEELERVPGIESVALTDAVPGPDVAASVRYAGARRAYVDKRDHPRARRAVVTPGFFETFRVDLLEGRDFNHYDGASAAPVAIVNRSFAAREWPGETALGQRLRVVRGDEENPLMTVVGVVPDLHMDGLRNVYRAGFYVPLSQNPRTAMDITARTSGNPLAVTSAVRERVRLLDSSLPVFAVQSLGEMMVASKFFSHLVATVFSILGSAALVLAAVGLYGVMAFSVSRRTAEMGLRMALGAASRDVVRLVVGHSVRQVGLGLGLGLLLASGVSRVLESLLFGVRSLDPLTFGTVAALLVGVGVAASLVPARRAMKVDPVEALRYE